MRFPLFPNWRFSRRVGRIPLALVQEFAAVASGATGIARDALGDAGSLNSIQVPGGKSVLVPLTAVDSSRWAGELYVPSSNPAVQLSLVSPTSKSIVMNVSGTDSSNVPFTGTIVMHLFEDLAPTTTARIEQLVTQGYYNGLLFHRVLDGFVAQTGQTNNGADTGQLLKEFDSVADVHQPGALGDGQPWARHGRCGVFRHGDRCRGTTTPITLADMPQFLNFKYTIFGQLVSGFDTFEKIMSAHVVTNHANQRAERAEPVDHGHVGHLDQRYAGCGAAGVCSGELRRHSATITVTATNANNETSQRTFSAAAAADIATQPPFLGPVSNQTTTQGTAVTFNLTSTNLSGAAITYKVGDATTFGTPANATVSINQATGQVTVTPAAGFTGTINLLAGVRASSAADSQANYDTQALTLTVNATTGAPATPAGVAVDSASNTGPFAGNGFITTTTPKLTVTAPTGSTVKFKLNGAVIATATETAAGSGIFTATLPAGTLGGGANMITATATSGTATSADSTALALTFRRITRAASTSSPARRGLPKRSASHGRRRTRRSTMNSATLSSTRPMGRSAASRRGAPADRRRPL